MKTIIVILLFSQCLFAESKSRLIDGTPEFAKWEVNNKVFWNDEDKDKYVTSQDVFIDTMVVVINRIITTESENKVIGSNLIFKNYSEFRDCVENPESFKRKKAQIK